MNYNKIEIIVAKKGYKVTPEGTLLNPNGKPMKGSKDSQGYIRGSFRLDGKRTNFMIHCLQAYQKYGDKIYQKGILTRHLDSDKSNNSESNIAIGTHSDNMMDQPKEQRIAKAKHAAAARKRHNYAVIRHNGINSTT
jgi:hypothetical protein